MSGKQVDTRPGWAKGTLRPTCPLCGNYVLPCAATATGVHPDKTPTLDAKSCWAGNNGGAP